MADLDELIAKWKGSSLELREAERLITLLIIHNDRLEKAAKEKDGWHEVVKHCEEVLGCEDTAESPLMSNLPNLVRDLRIAKTL